MDTDAIYSAIASMVVSSKRGHHEDAEFYQDEIKRLLNEADAERQELLATNEKLVDEVNELKAKLTDKASLLRGCYAADHKQKQRIEELTAERDALKAENERLTNCLKKANDQAEDFERRWYLVDMELERINALEPVAWEVYVASADHSYVVDSLDDPQLIDDCTNDDAVVTPLYALGSKT